MELKVAEAMKAVMSKSHTRRNVTEAIAQAKREGVVCNATKEDGVARVKIKVKKQDLKRVLELLSQGDCRGDLSGNRPLVFAEQNLILLRKKHCTKVSMRGSSWCPVLQSIPEEISS